ncbi:MAG: acetylornithine deacetylase [Reyranella sp.]|jgi:acetylornithine deacetylase|nr:acetylornithine deacetylase [Reyranella sp.]MBL6654106.1 acetylornithine deacetylase [Reyranella sp.]
MSTAPSSVDMLKRLVAFDTTSRNSNLELIHYIRDYLDDFGVSSTLVPSEDGRKANLFATIGPDREDGVVLSGHTDVVPVDGQAWVSDPWDLTAKDDGNLYGRGTCDMKGFVAACLSNVPAFQKAKLKVPMHFAFSYDEEIGCLGARTLAEKLVGSVPRPQAVIVGEPTMMGVVNAQNAGGGILATFTGVEAHSSMTHLGVSAIHFAGDFIHWLNELQVELAQRKRADLDTVPGHTTINVGIISGGTAGNILARECTLNWGYRTLPGDDPWEVQRRAEAYIAELLLPKMKAKHPDANITLKRRSFVPGLLPQENEEAARLALQWTGGNRTYAVPYGTEAGIFRGHGIPTVICGPGDIAQAHQPNEFVARSQMDACDTFLGKMIGWAERQ